MILKRPPSWLLSFCCLLLLPLSGRAQLVVNNGPSIDSLVSILTGSSLGMTNVTYQGATISRGAFTATGTNLGITSGIMLCTGSIDSAAGPNNSDSISYDLNLPGDNDLTQAANAQTHDAAVLEFDFVPEQDTVRFRYVFASDEYQEYVCSEFNDIFAFYISGPGIVGSPNIALIPGTAQAVAINSVNSGTPGAYANPNTPCNLGYSNFYVDNTGGTTIQYDGFTTVLEAKSWVMPCQRYHMKIAVADAIDYIYDSAVFFEAGSMLTSPVLSAGPDRILCNGSTTTIGNTTMPGWTYSWTPTTGLTNPNAAETSVQLTNTGTTPLQAVYVVSATDGTCTQHDTVMVTVNPFPQAHFTSNSPVCNGQAVLYQFNGTALPNATYSWSFPGAATVSGNGAGPYTVTYTAPGTYAGKLSITQYGCTSNLFIDSVRVGIGPTNTFTFPTPICQGDTITIQYTGNAPANAQFNWVLGNGQWISGAGIGPIRVAYHNANTDSIKLAVVLNGCQSPVLAQALVIKPTPVPNMSFPLHICSGDTFALSYTGTNTLAGTAFLWDFRGGTIISGNGQGPYQLSYPAGKNDTIAVNLWQNGCIASFKKPIQIISKPNQQLLPAAPVCLGDTSQFSLSSMPPAGTVYTYSFPGSIHSQGTAPGPYRVLWNSSGVHPYSVQLNNQGCALTLTDTAIVKLNPLVAFTSPPSVCSGDTATVTFSGSQILPGALFTWDFGQASTLSGNQAGPYQLSWNTSGTDSIRLTVSQDGCSATFSKAMLIPATPQASILLPSSGCERQNLPIAFNGAADPSAGFTWNLQQAVIPQVLQLRNFQADWTNAGTYGIQLLVDNQGCRDSITDSIRIYPTPVSQFNSNNNCLNIPVSFANLSSIVSNETLSYLWHFGDGNNSNLFSPTHLYALADSFQVQLITTSSQGCSDTSSQMIVAYPLPQMNFTSDSVCFGDAVTLDESCSIASGQIVSESWDFGDQQTAVAGDLTHLYAQAGSYVVTLYATSDQGCRDSLSRIVDVWNVPVPVLSANPLKGCQPLHVRFFDQSQAVDGTLLQWHWEFGDTETDSIKNPEHDYLNSGIYDVRLAVMNSKGCRADTIYPAYIEVFPKPDAAFSYNPQDPGLLYPQLYFYDQSSPVTRWAWTFGDGKTSNQQNPVHQYAAAGKYECRLIVTTSEGCKDTTYKEIEVKKDYALWVPNAFSPNGDQTNDLFEVKSIGITAFHLAVFSRWGALLFETSDLEKGWDGQFNGKEAVEDTYIWKITAKDILNKDHDWMGKVTLIR